MATTTRLGNLPAESPDDLSVEHRPVLVVGGGLIGLAAATFLAWRGVPVTLVERHAASSPHPRAIGYTPRTVELLHSIGLQLPPPPRLFEDSGQNRSSTGARVRRVRAESLAGRWFEELSWGPSRASDDPGIEYSPHVGTGLAQDRLEPLLRAKALELGADIRMCTELVAFEQDEDGVRALIGPSTYADGSESARSESARSRTSASSLVHANYLIAADGHRSPLREALAIGRHGRGFLHTGYSILFRAPLEEYLASGIAQFVIETPEFGCFVTTYADGRWLCMQNEDQWDPEADPTDVVTRALGRSDLGVEIITTGRWEISALVADTFTDNRVFLAGDAAHTFPPNRGAYGTGTGFEDAHNLAWKLAAVLAGQSGPALLDSYDAERRPIAWLCHQQLFLHQDFDADRPEAEPIDDAAMAFGPLYRSGAVLGADDQLPPAQRPEQWGGQPGTRAPHLWLRRPDGSRVSTLDLFGSGWVLLTTDARWAEAAEKAGTDLGIGLTYVRLGAGPNPDEPDAYAELEDPESFAVMYGLHQSGAVLVRPDGYQAWKVRELPEDPADSLISALARVAAVPAGGDADV